MESALTEAMPERAPNLTALLGPLLAARLISQAGSLQRLSELPASTIQVLGAERAFFEHLRGRAPPPRHGLLFLHPKLHSAPRLERGRLARALAGKVAIAARLDRAGRPLDPRLLAAFEGRATELDERRARRRSSRERPRRPTSST
jgi:nucleolar protein 56